MRMVGVEMIGGGNRKRWNGKNEERMEKEVGGRKSEKDEWWNEKCMEKKKEMRKELRKWKKKGKKGKDYKREKREFKRLYEEKKKKKNCR